MVWIVEILLFGVFDCVVGDLSCQFVQVLCDVVCCGDVWFGDMLLFMWLLVVLLQVVCGIVVDVYVQFIVEGFFELCGGVGMWVVYVFVELLFVDEFELFICY